MYTAWKRVYLEKDRMFIRGAYITDVIAAVAGGNRLTVSDIHSFTAARRSGSCTRHPGMRLLRLPASV